MPNNKKELTQKGRNLFKEALNKTECEKEAHGAFSVALILKFSLKLPELRV